MAIRVLGYKTVVEAKGTWPTNYIAKAQELKVLKDVKYKAYNDGAVRGNVALLIWNMLRTNMWDVESENEKDGLTYGNSKITMLNKFFEDYTYATVNFIGTESDDGKVYVLLNDNNSDEELEQKNKKYEYAGNDFYTFVSGEEVEVLVNEDDETLLTMVPTGADKVVEGLKKDIDEDYDELANEEYDYAYAIVKNKKIEDGKYTLLKINSSYIYEAKTQKSSVKLNKTTYSDDDYENAIVIVDGERASLRDVKEGMTLSIITLSNDEEVYIAVSDKVEGKFTKYVEKQDKNGNDYNSLTIDGKEYVDANATYVEDPEDSKEKQDKKLSSTDFKKYNMKNEVVTAYVDFVGRVTRLDFDGSIGDETSSDVKFFAAVSEVEKESKGVYSISLENENGKDDYYFEKNSTEASKLYADDANRLDGSFVAIKFNDDNEIVELIKIARATSGDPEITSETEFTYDEEDADGKFILEDLGDNISYDEDKEKIGKYLVDDSTVVVTVIFDDNGTKKPSDDKYTVTFEDATKAAKNIDDEKVLVIYDKAEKITYVKYIVRFDDATNSSDTLTGKLENVKYNKLDSEYVLTVDGKDYLYKATDNAGITITDYENGVIVFTLKENKDGDEYVQFTSGVKVGDLKDMILNDKSGDQTSDKVDDYVDEVSKKVVSFTTSGDMNVTSKDFQDEYKDYVFVSVEVRAETKTEQGQETIIADDDEIVVNVDEAIGVENITAADFTIGDRIKVDSDEKVMYIISGMEERA